MIDRIKATLEEAIIKTINIIFSSKFWFCGAILVAGLIRGGTEGYAAALGAAAFYTGTKAYQNVQFAKISRKIGSVHQPIKLHDGTKK